jgi:uncharacterized protein
MEYKRSQYFTLKKRIREKRKFIQVLSGPRQVGKTTLLHQLLNDEQILYHFASADGLNINDAEWISQQWEIARLKLDQSNSKNILLVLDEIQKIKNWSEAVKSYWDDDTRLKKNIKVILSGSSRLMLQHGLTESLTGRFESIYMGHWTYTEMQSAFGWDLNQYIWFGGYPGSAELIKDEQRWKEYIKTSIIETSISIDILQLTRIEKPALLKKLFELGCLYSGQILSFNKILGQLQDAGNTTTLAHYLNLLSTAGLITGIEKFSLNKIRTRSSSPKFIVYNNALISSQLFTYYDDLLHQKDIWGRVVESSIGAYLINSSISNNFEVYYWRHLNDEIDFVLRRRNKIIGLEVKSGLIKNLDAIKAFNKIFKPDKTFIIGETGIGLEEFLLLDPAELF